MNGGLLRFLMAMQHSRDDQRGFIDNQRPESMGDCGIQRTQYEHARKLYKPAFNCDAEVYGVYLDNDASSLAD